MGFILLKRGIDGIGITLFPILDGLYALVVSRDDTHVQLDPRSY